MKKSELPPQNELRREYKRADFTGPLVRGKYAKRLREASNIVVLKPDVAAAFPNEEAVNKALQSLIAVAQATTSLTKRSNVRGKKSRAA
jgi:hypothetical protein